LVNLAYIISAYKLPQQLVRLVDRLDTPDVAFFVHVDRKTDDRVFDMVRSALADRSNVTFVRRHRSDWGGFGHVAATLEGIDAVLTSGTPFDYAILLTGQDYPIKSNEAIRRFFDDGAGRLYIEFFPLPHPEWEQDGMNRIEQWHWRVRGRHVAIAPGRLIPFRRTVPGGLPPFGGSSYWNLSRAALEYVHAYVRSHRRYVDFFRRVDVPDELFFQTILLNSPFAEAAVSDDLRYLEWDVPDTGSPRVLTSRELPRLASSSALFARKFDVTADAGVLDEIDRTLLRCGDRERAGSGQHLERHARGDGAVLGSQRDAKTG
jgi:hypothetical protein